MRALRKTPSGFLLALLAVLTWTADPALAQTLDEVQVQAVQADTVVHVHFNGRVRLVRFSPSTPTDLVQVFFQIVALDDPNNQPTVEEAKVSPSDAPGPAFALTYPYQANALVRELRLQFDTHVQVQVREGVDGRSIDVVVQGGASLGKPAAAQGAAASAAVAPAAALPEAAPAPVARPHVTQLAIALQRVEDRDATPPKMIPKDLENYVVFTNPLPGTKGGYELDVGYFSDAAAAEAVRQKVLASFPDAVVFDADARKEANLTAVASLPHEAAPAPDSQAAPTDQQTLDARADELLGSAADAVTANNFAGAIDILNQVLLLPPNSSTQTAQELLGVARERAGDIAGAHAEYDRYLRLFPQGEGADRVGQRIANLPDNPKTVAAAAAPAAASAPNGATPAAGAASAGAGLPAEPGAAPSAGKTVPAQKNITGSISQFYYGGATRATTILSAPTGISQSTLTGLTQSSIVTNLDATARYKDADSDSRMVLRDTNSSSLISTSHGNNLLSAAYLDYKNLNTSLGVRVGRQSAATAGAIGLFDGISVGYSPTTRLRLTASAGQPSDPLTAAHERFEGFDAQVDEVLPGLGVGIYGINQTVDGAVSRRALGLDFRFFTPKYSLYAASDYDTAFKATNSLIVQGTMTTEQQEVISVLLDHRRVPSLDLGNALIGSNFTSLQTMLQQIGYAQTQQLAAQVAAVSRQAVLSYARPLGEHWQGNTDIRWTDVGALPAVGLAPAQAATGAQMGYSLVATGSNLYSSHDTNVFNVTVLNSAQLHGGQLSYNNLTGFWDNTLSLEPSMRVYVENNISGQHTTRWTPGMRAAYRLGPDVSFESEAILEVSRVTGASVNEDAKNAFFYVGYRYDFR